ncbi:TonB-dependent receptor [bacterium SCSIO 12643]|nr:TonB-dependent receptor [bacterium SCSIO 12643]
MGKIGIITRVFFCTCLCVCLASHVWSQASLSGVITDENNQNLPGALIQLSEKKYTTSDLSGKYKIENIEPGNYTISVSYMGFQTLQKTITFSSGEKKVTNFRLKENSQQLNTVVVTGKSSAEEKREVGYAVDVLETRELKNIVSDVNQVIKMTPGIHIRESGGLGSGFKLSVNGLSGNQIRFFIDYIPMENFGSALSMNNIPVNLIDRVEVYKGVVPISLGADALGGAIHILSGYKKKIFLDASYSYGSFNTHRASVNTQYTDQKKKYYVKASTFFNHSDNDYTMKSVPVYDLELGNKIDDIETRRFHDQYTSGMVSGEIGIFDKKVADDWSVKFTYAENKNNYQHPDNNILRPFGQFHTRNKTFLASTQYNKQFKKLHVRGYVLGGLIQDDIIDTSTYKYNWAGDRIQRLPNDPKGEIMERRSHFIQQNKVIRGQLNLQYAIDSVQTIDVSISQNFLERSGEDLVDELNQSFSSPNTIYKHIYGGAYTIKNKQRTLEGSTFIKQYAYSGKIVVQDNENKDVITNVDLSHTGYGAVFSWKPNLYWTVKSSYERAYRFPEGYEILGDGIYVTPNPALKPESSHNINLGMRFKKYVEKSLWVQELKLFFRKSEDFIRFNPIGPFGSYENLRNVNTLGAEYALQYTYDEWIQFQLNGTYQHITDQSEFDEGLPNANYQSRIPNIPYLFGNTRIGVSPFKSWTHRKITFYYGINYVHEFYLTWKNSGNSADKNIIPRQLTHNVDIEYAMKDGMYNLSLNVSNLTDALVYDNFNIQKPGRAVYLKFRMFLAKK